MNDAGHMRTIVTSKSAVDITLVSHSLQPNVSWNVLDSPFDSDHCVTTTNILTRSQETQKTVTKFNMNKKGWHLFTSNEVWKQTTNPSLFNSAEILNEFFL